MPTSVSGTHDVAPGALIDQRYALVARLGEGTFGDVWRAEDTRLSHRAVAVKFLKAEFLAHAEAVSRFESEADALAQVQHANVVAVLDRGLWSGHRFLVTEFVSGAPLTHWIDGHRQRREFPSIAAVANLLDQLCAGVEAAHAVRVPGPIVHRDLKPDNVLLRDQVTGETVVKVVDFGIAQLGGRSGTRTGAMMGTPVYMAPEQALGNVAAIGPATDVFALAVIAVELLTLRAMPNEGEPWWGMAMQRSGEMRALAASWRADVPAAVWDVLVAAMHPRSAERVSTAGALRRSLKAAFEVSSMPYAPTMASVPPGAAVTTPTPGSPPIAVTMPLQSTAPVPMQSMAPAPTLWSAPPPSASTTAPLMRSSPTATTSATVGVPRWVIAAGAAAVLATGVLLMMRSTSSSAGPSVAVASQPSVPSPVVATAPTGTAAVPSATVDPSPPSATSWSPCLLTTRDSFHLRPTDTESSVGPEYPVGTLLEVLEPGTAVRRSSVTHRVRVANDGAEGYAFFNEREVQACQAGTGADLSGLCVYASHSVFHLRAAPVVSRDGADEITTRPRMLVVEAGELTRGSERIYEVHFLDGSGRAGWMFIPVMELGAGCPGG